MPGDDGKALDDMSLWNQAAPLRDAVPRIARRGSGEPNGRAMMSHESRRLAESIVKSLRCLGLECELIEPDNHTH